jgi:hypothetical protein
MYENPVCTSQESHYFSNTMLNQLMFFSEKVDVYCDNKKEDKYTLWMQKSQFYCAKLDGT